MGPEPIRQLRKRASSRTMVWKSCRLARNPVGLSDRRAGQAAEMECRSYTTPLPQRDAAGIGRHHCPLESLAQQVLERADRASVRVRRLAQAKQRRRNIKERQSERVAYSAPCNP